MDFMILQNLRFLNQSKFKDKILLPPREQLRHVPTDPCCPFQPMACCRVGADGV